MVSEILAEEEVAVFFVVEAAEFEFVGLCAALHGDVLRFTFLIRNDAGNGGVTEFQFRLDTEKLLRTSNQGAVQRETHITGFKQLYDFVFLAFVFQVELVLEIEGGLGVLVDVEIDLIADFRHHVQLNLLVEIKVCGVLQTFAL